jgi:hypothetical protein
MAPEVLRGDPVSPACDVFSWGSLIVYAATGKPAFGGDTLPATVYQVLNTEPALDAVEPGLRELVRAALRKDPAARPAAQQLLDHLVGRETVQPEQAAHTVQVTWQHGTAAFAEAQPPTARRKRRLVAAAVAGVAVLVAGAITGWALLRDGGPPDLAVLYQEDFTQTSGGWEGTYDQTDEYSYGYRTDGTYGLDVVADDVERLVKAPAPFLIATPTPMPSASATPTPMLPQTVVVGVTSKVQRAVGTGEYGVYCHNSATGTYYEFALDTSGKARIRRISDGSGGTLAQPVQVDGLKDRTARIEAACEQDGSGVRLTMWVNGERVHQVSDPNGLGNGYVGLFARTSKNETSVLKTTFDDFELRGRKEP